MYINMPNKEEILEFIKEIIRSEQNFLLNMPDGCQNSYGAGVCTGSIQAANRIKHFIETGEDLDD